MSPLHPKLSSLPAHRIVALTAIVFLTALQTKNLRDLSGSGIGKSDVDAAWAPVAMGEAKPTKRGRRGPELRATTTRAKRKQRAKAEKHHNGKEGSGEADDNQKKKKHKKPQRFMATNYTHDFEPLPWTLPKPTPIRYQTSEEFMADYITAKRRHSTPLPWEQLDKYAEKPVTLPLPIISLNFPKSATLTMKAYFDCGGITSIHTSTQDGRIALCMMENHLSNRPPMEGCNTHKVRHSRKKKGGPEHGEIVPIDFISDIGLQGPPCYYPGVHDGGLENIVKHYPNATILLVTRDAASWYRSMKKWGSIVTRLVKYCGFSGELHSGSNMRYWNDMYQSTRRRSRENFWVNIYQSHTQKLREFAMKHLSMTYVEVEMENERIGEILEGYTGVSPKCVMHCHPGPKWVRENNATSRCHPVGEGPVRNHVNPFVDQEEEEEENIEEEDSGNEDDEIVEEGDNSEDDNSAENELTEEN
eukprot:CAMPEP_0172526236 /NCGR_PEP_ID=MMETSP1067-20121228/1183_1 /TAXON_ID=265564 ORGANISM="Thalassiosira punctigera, Strain Tpunct2005C2" /NCGR_SAMPLE_ID=MMETSP1067 /ASSEMBLY_ACC=CAM_ASM_000444 /LENGTH=472 /DNA_ID=CAMNT_0013309697 /DNA_START=145 /DNA_END=1563 /DNA_ORIENTATION=-